MLAVIIDRSIKEISEYTGLASCSDLSLLSCKFIEYQVKELRSIGVNQILYYGKKRDICWENVTAFDSVDDLVKCINKFNSQNIIVTSSCVFFEFKPCCFDFDLSSVGFTDESGEKCCVLLNKRVFSDLISVYDDKNALISEIFNRAKTDFKCAKNVYTLEDIKSYKRLINLVLDGKTALLLPIVAGGVYASGKIPEGNFVIIPPVYFGTDVQVESDCIIGPHSVIFDNCLVSKNSFVKETVLMAETYISSNCFLENVFCGENVSVRRDAAVFGSSILGKGVTVAESTFVENESKIRPFTNVSEYKNKVINYRINESGSGFSGYSPEKAALLGSAVGTVYNGAKIGILCNGEINAQILKYAVVSGLMSTGVECFDFGFGYISMLQFFINYCQLDYGVFISGTDNGTMISVINKKFLELPKDDYYSIKELMLNSSVKKCEKGECKKIRRIRGMKEIYIQNLIKNIKNELNVFPCFNCSDRYAENIFYTAFSKLKYSANSDKITFNISANTGACECVAGGKKYNHSKLCDFIEFYDKSYSIYGVDLWRNDAVYLCFKVLEIISAEGVDFKAEIENIPSFYLAEKVIETDKKLPYFASRLPHNVKLMFKHNELCLNNGDLRFKIMENGKHNKIKVLARSYRSELANELLVSGEKLLLSSDISVIT